MDVYCVCKKIIPINYKCGYITVKLCTFIRTNDLVMKFIWFKFEIIINKHVKNKQLFYNATKCTGSASNLYIRVHIPDTYIVKLISYNFCNYTYTYYIGINVLSYFIV